MHKGNGVFFRNAAEIETMPKTVPLKKSLDENRARNRLRYYATLARRVIFWLWFSTICFRGRFSQRGFFQKPSFGNFYGASRPDPCRLLKSLRNKLRCVFKTHSRRRERARTAGFIRKTYPQSPTLKTLDCFTGWRSVDVQLNTL